MKLEKLLSEVSVIASTADMSTDISSVVSRADKAGKNSLFIARRGKHHDGVADVPFAIESGASVIVTDDAEALRYGAPTVTVGNILLAEAMIYSAYYEAKENQPRVIAVTGTNGKSSVCAVIGAIAEECGECVGIIGTLGAFVGDRCISRDSDGPLTTPEPCELYRIVAEMKKLGVTTVVMEASSHALAEYRIDGLKIDVGVFLNLGRDHLDYHLTTDKYLTTKARLLTLADKKLTNAEDKSYEAILRIVETSEISAFSAPSDISANAEYIAYDIRSAGADGVSYRIASPMGEIVMQTPIIGKYAVANTLAAAAASLMAGFGIHDIERAVKNHHGIPGRMERIETKADFTVFIDYAHTPEALAFALTTLREAYPKSKFTVLFGCGGERDTGKRPIMGHIASTLADRVVVTDDNPRSEAPAEIRRQIISGIDGGAEVTEIPDRESAIIHALDTAEDGEVILLAGKGHESYQITADGKHPFSEADIVRNHRRAKGII